MQTEIRGARSFPKISSSRYAGLAQRFIPERRESGGPYFGVIFLFKTGTAVLPMCSMAMAATLFRFELGGPALVIRREFDRFLDFARFHHC